MQSQIHTLMSNSLVTAAEKYVQQLIVNQLTDDHKYHDWHHTLSVKEMAIELGVHYQLSEEDLECLVLAALFHDTGFVEIYDGHEAISQQLASNFLKENNYATKNIEKICNLIEATKPEKKPDNLLQKIIKDADLNNVGRKGYFGTVENLRHEWEVFNNRTYEDVEFLETNLAFLDEHQFFTTQAESVIGQQKKKNRNLIKKKIKKLSADGANKEQSPLTVSKSAQMIFKTSLRNHIDLTSIADSKANIMLSINALIISISLPFLGANIPDHPYLIAPAAILLVTCMLSIIFATLATRPIKTMGLTDLSKIQEGKTNLFFFGNFYKMDINDYKKGISEVLADDKIIESAIVSDLFYLGKSLGTKFHQLRICYGIFMFGITITVISFAISFSIFG